ncbi:hypothetical protein JKP88DRAFT_247650 [Tribonema minus]|uniref:AAA+ ATPase domain-containing protein n=1 Tax=Tribonema minus TaxID=303371 RepID=A0A836CBR1_9STRA|nr:hypothetical protein JKP88DRAFT_247650 [Tribonema minus]
MQLRGRLICHILVTSLVAPPAEGFVKGGCRPGAGAVPPHAVCRSQLPVVAAAAAGADEIARCVGSAFGVGTNMFKLAESFGWQRTAKAVSALQDCRIRPKLAEERIVERECSEALKYSIQYARSCQDHDNVALLVTGPRGGGKTVLVEQALEQLPGVIRLSYYGDSSNVRGWKVRHWIAREVLESIEVDWRHHFKRAPSAQRFQLIAQLYKALSGRERLVLVLEVGEQASIAAVEKLLWRVKVLGYEQGLITCVVVSSASRSAMLLPIDLGGLRVEVFNAPDFTDAEAHDVIRLQLPELLLKYPHLAKEITDKVGTRAMHIAEVCRLCSKAEAVTEEDCRVHIKAVADRYLRCARGWVRSFVNSAVASNAADPDDVNEFLGQLSEGDGELTRADAKRIFGFITGDDLFAALSANKAFAIDLDSGRVKPYSFFTQAAIQKYLQAQAGSNS